MACHALIDHRALPLTRKAQEGAFGVKRFSRMRSRHAAPFLTTKVSGEEALIGKRFPHVFPVLRMLYTFFFVMNSL